MCKSQLCLLFMLILSLDCVHLVQKQKATPNWDVLLFTQQWPPTVCKIWRENPSHICNLPKNEDAWTVHGIWPTSTSGGEFPEFCNKSWPFDPELVRPIEKDLNVSWVNIEYSTSLYSFWAHEWSKHGTCAAILEPLNTEFKYFTRGLEWLKKYSMDDILASAGIVPSNSKEYQLSDFNDTVKQKLGVSAMFECRFENHEQYLVEIRLCFTKSLQICNCEKTIRANLNNDLTLGNCNPSKGIIYPQNDYAYRRLIVQLYKLANWLQWFTL